VCSPPASQKLVLRCSSIPGIPGIFLYIFTQPKNFLEFCAHFITGITVQITIKSAKTAPSEGYSCAHVFKP
jgi:hypothetical protein